MLNKEKKLCADIAKVYGKNKPSIHEIVEKKKEIPASFVVTPQTAKAMAIVHDKCLVMIEKLLNLWVEDEQKTCSN